MQGRRRDLALRRTSVQIETGDLTIPVWKQTSLKLQKGCELNGKWRMSLVGGESEGRYFLEALNGVPFILNGTPCLRAWPLRGDKLLFDYNLLEGKTKLRREEDKSLDRFAPLEIVESNLSVLIEGETGTGKSSLAQKIHEQSCVPGDFVALNLRAFNSQLLESELFGHVKGAFTGAIREKTGALALAEEGTLFLDEIDSLSEDIQTKMLLFLDTLEYRPVGAERCRRARTRMLFASGGSMKDRVNLGKCRADFYFRISQGAVIKMKPLRESQEELKLALTRICLEEEIALDRELYQFYLDCHWPGNYRQLVGHLKRKKALSKSDYLVLDEVDSALLEIGLEELSFSAEDQVVTLEEAKRCHVWKVYLKQKGNIIQTARRLNISKNTVKRILSKKGEVFSGRDDEKVAVKK